MKPTKLEKIEKNITLFSLYKTLLTEKQVEIFSLYYEQDYSLEEIAQMKNLSKVAIFDMLNQAIKSLDKYEKSLKLEKKIKILKDRNQDDSKLSDLIDEIFYEN